MENLNSTLPAIKTEEIINIIKQAPDILEKNTIRRNNAVNYGQELIKHVEAHGMTDDMDKLMATYLKKLDDAEKSFKVERSPFTSLADEIKKLFTKLEADISSKNNDNIYFKVQAWRNQYATAKIEEQKKREREAAIKLAAQKELVSVKETIEQELTNNFGKFLSHAKRDLINLFESITLENVDEFRNKIAFYPSKLNIDIFKNCNPVLWISYTSKEQVFKIQTEASTRLYTEFNYEFSGQIEVLKRELIDKIGSKLNELNRIANASKMEADQIKGEAEQRRKEAELKANLEAEQATKKAAEEAAQRAAAASMEASINMQADLFQEAPKVKESVQIIFKNTEANVVIYNFWWLKEGRTLPQDKIDKMTMLRMKAFCENYALKYNEKIKNDLVEYKEVYKAK